MSFPWSSAFHARCKPRPPLTVSEWADRNRIVPPGTSPEPGAWRTDRVPYLREILDAVSNPSVERVVVMAASQVAKSEILLNTIGYFAHHDPSPILLVQATEDAAKSFSKERVAPTFAASPVLRGLLDPSERSTSNTVMLKSFPGGMLAVAWAGSAASLASRPIRVVLGDELDRWPDTTGRDGDPWAQAVQRTSNFFNRKVIAVSTPTLESLSAIARLYEDSDQCRYHVPCPHCGTFQFLEWGGIVYKNAKGEIDLENVHYVCAHCREPVAEHEKPAMLAQGEWVPENPGNTHRGYHISALYSPWVRWAELAREWIKANTERDKHGLQEFINLRLGETWTEAAQRITTDELAKNREEYAAEVPDGALLLTGAVDVQDNRLEAEVIGWGVGKESWGIEYKIFSGDTSQPHPWLELDAWLQIPRHKADGRAFALWCVCVDSGGHRTDEVYEFCRVRLARQVFAIKGRGDTPGLPIIDKPTLNKLRAPLYGIGVDTGKDAVFSRLALASPGPGYCHWPIGRGYDDEYFRGLLSEKRVPKRKNGRRVGMKWVQTYTRNEPLDIRVYGTAALELCYPDIPGSPGNLEALAAADAKARAADAKARAAGGGGAAPAAAPARRRILSKGVQW